METIDGATFNELRDTAGAEFVTELVDTFLEEAPQMLADLKRARDSADADRFRRAAHSLKSNGATFGALEFASLARTLELGGLAADPARDVEAIAALDAAYARAAAALKGMCRG
jgi:HPt (histidine-containing phosphotransfer) domain-containing protein